MSLLSWRQGTLVVFCGQLGEQLASVGGRTDLLSFPYRRMLIRRWYIYIYQLAAAIKIV